MTKREELQHALIWAMKEKRNADKEILRVAIGEIQSVESREGSITEEKCQKILKKMINNTQQNLDQYSDKMTEDQIEQAKNEMLVLDDFVDRTLTKEEVVSYLNLSSDPSAGLAIMNEPNVGKAIGLAMKYFKKIGDSVDGKVVAEVVKKMKE